MTSLQQLAALPRCNDLARLTRAVLFASSGVSAADLQEVVAEHASTIGLKREDSDTPQGNVFDALARPEFDPAEGAFLGNLLAYAIALDAPREATDVSDAATKLTQLAARGIDGFDALDEAMGDRASTMWAALADLLQRHDADGTGITRPEAVIAAAALAKSKSDVANTRARALQGTLRSRMLSSLLGGTASAVPANESSPPLSGELSPAPRGTIATVFLAICGWMLVAHVARLFGRFALKLRRPAEVRVTPQGIRIKASTTLLGKVLRETDTVIPYDALVRATREVRFPRTGTYAGLIALALGSYLGVSWFVDGVRAASASLAGVGVLVLVLGVVLDFVFMSLLPGRKGRCRVVFVPKRGGSTCVGWVNATEADTFLQGLARR